jgi:hypothetical protein
VADRVFAIVGDWALGSDGVQWMLCRRCNDRGRVYWRPVSFVRSTRDILARCMREKGVIADMARSLLSGLPDSFDEWKSLSNPVVAVLAANEVADG